MLQQQHRRFFQKQQHRFINCNRNYQTINNNAIVKRSNLFLPTLRDFNQKEKTIESHKLLIKSGYIRQTNLGIYNYLPFGLRVLNKIEELIDISMKSIHGQKLAMPLLLNADNWKKTGRWETTGDELFRLKDRHDVSHCLSPTHEEVVTEIVAQNVFSHRDLPLSLYQIGKKYRDERRPRFGPMRAREFIMKDMYSFDKSETDAFETYEKVREAYHKIFKALELIYVEVEADSGNIGGNLSHEFHVLNNIGEDLLLTCDTCKYSANVEKATPYVINNGNNVKKYTLRGKCKKNNDGDEHRDGDTVHFINIIMPATIAGNDDVVDQERLNETKILTKWNDMLIDKNIIIDNYSIVKDFDDEVSTYFIDASVNIDDDINIQGNDKNIIQADYLLARDGDRYRACNGEEGILKEKRGIEVGHIFYLGKKYSSILNATFMDSNNKTNTIEMGCYGIGISRILAAAIENNLVTNGENDDINNNNKTKKGKQKNQQQQQQIIWPSIIAPYQCVVLTAMNNDVLIDYATELSMKLIVANNHLKDEIIIDDRWSANFGVKMKEATLWGAPIKIILGKSYLNEGKVEIETCKGIKLHLNEAELIDYMQENVVSIEEKYFEDV